MIHLKSSINKQFLFAFLILLLLGLSDVQSQTSQDTSSVELEQVSKKPHPNTVPYSSENSVGEHLLAFPSYLLHWTTRPIGWGVKWAEEKVPQLLQGERAPYGLFPLFELGGEVNIAYGLLLYHNRFLEYNHRVRIEALFGSENYNDFDFEYTVPTEAGWLELDASYSNDPVKSFYGGNDSNITDEQLYATEILQGDLEYRQAFTKSTQFRLSSRYRNIDIGQNEIIADRSSSPVPASLRGTTALLSFGSSVHWDFAEGAPRTSRGSRYTVGLNWNKSLTDHQFHYFRYTLEWHQFLPIFFLPNSRRLALKGNIQKAEALGGRRIPFFDYPGLGSSYNLRGFPSDRFRDDGSLLFTLEYRYPMWSFADVVFFVDEGQVFSQYSGITIKDFHTSYGFGFHLISTKGFAFRSEFAFSRESSRVILTINPNF